MRETVCLLCLLRCCHQYYAHVLSKYSDQELSAVVDVATGRAPWRSSDVISNYKEIQVCLPCMPLNVVWRVCVGL